MPGAPAESDLSATSFEQEGPSVGIIRADKRSHSSSSSSSSLPDGTTAIVVDDLGITRQNDSTTVGGERGHRIEEDQLRDDRTATTDVQDDDDLTTTNTLDYNEAAAADINTATEERTVAWLSLGKQAAESRCQELERELREARTAIGRQESSVRVASEKIRHLEAQSKGFLAAAEFRENEAKCLQEGTDLAQERAHAQERALAGALEQLSESGVAQSKKLAELASATEELKRTKEALEQAERIVYDQRREADERQLDEIRRQKETDSLRDKLRQAERKNTELMAKQAAGRIAKKMQGKFGRSSTFCASFCSCFRGKPAYRRVASPAPLAGAASGSSDIPDIPWLA